MEHIVCCTDALKCIRERLEKDALASVPIQERSERAISAIRKIKMKALGDFKKLRPHLFELAYESPDFDTTRFCDALTLSCDDAIKFVDVLHLAANDANEMVYFQLHSCSNSRRVTLYIYMTPCLI